MDEDGEASPKTSKSKAKSTVEQRAWPASLPEQVRAVADLISASTTALEVDAITAHFKARGAWKKSLPTILQILEATGRAHSSEINSVTMWSS